MHISSQHTFYAGHIAHKPLPNAVQPEKVDAPKTDSVQLSPEASAIGAASNTAKPPANPYATNILNAINGQLTVDLADNATKDELQSRLNAGLSGFLQGFGEALSELEGVAGFSPQIANEIGETKRQVLEGLAAKGEELGLDISKINDELKSLDAQASRKLSSDLKATSVQPTMTREVSAYQSRSFEFELTTQEGDKIKILLDSMQAGQIAMDEDQHSIAYGSADGFSIRVDGELNEKELGAINELLGKVNQLSKDFFDGDLKSAFDQAMNMGFDAQQIKKFSLHLSQTSEVTSSIGQKAARAYQADTAQSQSSARLNTLNQYLKEVEQTYQSARTFGMNKSTFVELSEFVSLSYREEVSAYKELLDKTLANS